MVAPVDSSLISDTRVAAQAGHEEAVFEFYILFNTSDLDLENDVPWPRTGSVGPHPPVEIPMTLVSRVVKREGELQVCCWAALPSFQEGRYWGWEWVRAVG